MDMKREHLCPGKQEWPELVGAGVEEAKRVIEMENPRVRAVIVREDAFVTSDYRCDRVRVRIPEEGHNKVVVAVPRVG